MIRPIVKDAWKVNELVYQFSIIDVEDGYLQEGTPEEINEKYSDHYIVKEAYHRLDIAMDPANQEEECWRRDAAQLRRFIAKWSAKLLGTDKPLSAEDKRVVAEIIGK